MRSACRLHTPSLNPAVNTEIVERAPDGIKAAKHD
jgi:hypothetical protein